MKYTHKLQGYISPLPSRSLTSKGFRFMYLEPGLVRRSIWYALVYTESRFSMPETLQKRE